MCFNCLICLMRILHLIKLLKIKFHGNALYNFVFKKLTVFCRYQNLCEICSFVPATWVFSHSGIFMLTELIIDLCMAPGSALNILFPCRYPFPCSLMFVMLCKCHMKNVGIIGTKFRRITSCLVAINCSCWSHYI